MTDQEQAPSRTAIQARQREMAVEHIVFQLLRHLERQSPGLIDEIESSLNHLGDPANDGTADDATVVEIARKLLAAAR
jgi:hypothetical protein